jgi:ubiquinol-cytochrome c reductase cytochrome b subunit
MAMLLTAALVIGLGALSYRQDAMNPAVADRLSLQSEMDVRYMAAPFKVDMIGSFPATASPENQEVAQGKQVFENQGCHSCHGEGGVGTAIAPKLIGIVQKFGPEQLADLIRHPTEAMTSAGMPTFDMPDAKMRALIAYLNSLQ